ncbi:MAG: hypothetical protein GQ534_02175 [Candidatus Delongbacteria bacterium]|nr:hypothetical protein [Candidatus Delongbacteria bacterium]
MKKHLLPLLLTLSISLFSAKIGNENFNGFKTGYMSISGNYLPSSISSINSYVENFGLEGFDDFILTWGIELTGNVNSNVSTGVQYYTGWDKTQKIVSVPDTVGFVDLDRCVDYNITYYGIILNYRRSFTGSMEYFGSFSANYGSIELIFSQDEGDQYFDNMLESFDPISGIFGYNRSSSLEMGLWMFTIDSGIKYYISDRLAIGGSIGYTYGLVDDSGILNYGFETLNGVPDLDFDGMKYTISLYYGS